MSAPKWAAGTLYPTGSLVQPLTAFPTTQTPIANPGFETGDATGWTIGANMSINAYGRYAGLWALQLDTGVNTGPLGQEAVNDTEVEVTPGQKITARCMVHQGASSTGNAGGWVRVKWYDAAHAFISNSDGNNVKRGDGGAIHPSTVAAIAPAGAAYARIAGVMYRVNQNFVANVDEFSWDYRVPVVPDGLIYKAVQPIIGTSDGSEPTWPLTVGVQVVDGTVIWEAIIATRITWEASPILLSAAIEPTWPEDVGAFVADNTISWKTVTRQVTEAPQSKIVTIASSKVYAGDGDITRYSATVNPLDWTTPDDAGYLPTGLNQYGSNRTAVLNTYRGNVVPFSASTFLCYQADPDPANITQLDAMEGIGSTYQQAAHPVANDLFYLSPLGVRTVGIAVGTANLSAGDAGAPIDPLVQAALVPAGIRPMAAYYPNQGQYWLCMRPPLPVVVGPTITGAAPDGTEGDTYPGYQYTVTAGDAPISSVENIGNPWPTATPALDIDITGLLSSGLALASGTYTPLILVTDENGLTATLDDSIDIGQVPPVWMAWVNGSTLVTTGLIISPDGLDWSAPLSTMTGYGLTGAVQTYDAAVLYGKVVLVTNTETTVGADPSNRYFTTSDAGLTLSDSNPGVTGTTGGTYHPCAVGGGYAFRAVITGGFAGVWRSADLLTWAYFPMPAFEKATALAYKGTRLMSISTGRDYPHYSDDNAATWTKGTEDAFGGANINPNALCATPTRFIATVPETGAEGVRWSATGLGVWTAATVTMTSGDIPGACAYGNGIVVVGCRNATGKVYFSTDDGTTFTLASDALGGPCQNVYYAAGLFVAGTINGKISTSTDGNTWTLRYTNPDGLAIGAIARTV